MSALTRAGALALALAAAVASPASAQVTSATLGQVDPWGVGWLGKTEGALPSGIWANTTADTLAPLYAALQPSQLSPSARMALRRIVLSATKTPTEGAALAPERLRLIEQIGETERSIDLRKRFPETDWGKQADRIASDFELSQGRSQTACARAADKRGDDPAWMPVRALCFAIAGDFKAASPIVEQIRSGDEKWDLWFLTALGVMQAPGKTRPDGRYGTALDAAVSIAAKLPAPVSALLLTPPDIAAAIVQNPAATIEQKRAALRPALEGGKIKAPDLALVLALKDETPTAKPANSRATAAAAPGFLDLALSANNITDPKGDAKATAFTAALKAAESSAEFHLTALALADAIKTLPKTDATLPNAETFARAALVAGDIKEAAAWRKLMDTAAKDKADPWAAARVDLLIAFATDPAKQPSAGAIVDHMIAAMPPADASTAVITTKAATPVQRQADLRRIENTRALFLLVGTGRDLSPSQRTLLATFKTAGRGVSDSAITRITAAVDQDADGEAAMAVLGQLGQDVSALSFAGLADLLVQLRRAGFDRDASAIALEALQAWKAL
jgi:hypothetical protein